MYCNGPVANARTISRERFMLAVGMPRKRNLLMQIISWRYYGNGYLLHCCPFVISLPRYRHRSRLYCCSASPAVVERFSIPRLTKMTGTRLSKLADAVLRFYCVECGQMELEFGFKQVRKFLIFIIVMHLHFEYHCRKAINYRIWQVQPFGFTLWVWRILARSNYERYCIRSFDYAN